MGRGALTLAIAALGMGLLTGCPHYYGIVRTEGAPLYADRSRSTITRELDELSEVYLGRGEPQGDPVQVTFGDEVGYVELDDLLVFPAEDRYAHADLVRRMRREVVLAEKPWPEPIKRSLRHDRLQVGMTREMAVLGWGMPSSVAQEGEREQWRYEEHLVEVHSTRYHYWRPPMYVGFGVGSRYGPGCRGGYYPSWYGLDYPYGSPLLVETIAHTYVPRTVRRSITFVDGLVAGWE